MTTNLDDGAVPKVPRELAVDAPGDDILRDAPSSTNNSKEGEETAAAKDLNKPGSKEDTNREAAEDDNVKAKYDSTDIDHKKKATKGPMATSQTDSPHFFGVVL